MYLEELKSEHNLDFMEGTAERLLRHVVHHALPAIILDEFRNVLTKSFPTFKEFFDNLNTVVNKLQDKTESLEKSKPSPKLNSVSSTIPEEAINTVRSHNSKTDNAKQKVCMFCGSLLYLSSLCPL